MRFLERIIAKRQWKHRHIMHNIRRMIGVVVQCGKGGPLGPPFQ